MQTKTLLNSLSHRLLVSALLAVVIILTTIQIAYAGNNTFPGSGNVGIGTGSPTELLHVQADSGQSTKIMMSEAGKSNGFWLTRREPSDNSLQFKSDPRDGSSKLDVLTLKEYGEAIVANKLTIDGNKSVSGNLPIFQFNENGVEKWQVFSNNSSDYVIRRFNADAFSIKQSNGWVGIGTVQPQHMLDVRGSVAVGGSDLMLGKYDGRNSLANTQNRALVHADSTVGYRNDMLIVNFNNDFEGGTLVGSDLFVDGKMTAKGISAKADIWADYVFAPDYKLMSLKDVDSYIKENGHLPNVPSAEKVLDEGIDVAKMDAKLLEKIEELTLYSIQQQVAIEELRAELDQLKAERNN